MISRSGWRLIQEDDVPRRFDELTRQESLRLLGEAFVGRMVYTMQALPVIVPVCHLVDDGMVVVRTHLGTQFAGSVVAYQADMIDPENRLGWTVTVTGVARRVLDAKELTHYAERLEPLVYAEPIELVRIYPEIVTGYRLIPNV
jgi:hypothetical protein